MVTPRRKLLAETNYTILWHSPMICRDYRESRSSRQSDYKIQLPSHGFSAVLPTGCGQYLLKLPELLFSAGTVQCIGLSSNLDALANCNLNVSSLKEVQ